MEEYTQGFDVTQNLQYQAHQCVIDAYEMGLENGIEQGRNEAWEAARKIHVMFGKDIEKIFSKPGEHSVYSELSASEAIEKIKAWEENKGQDDEINVGDEVYILDKTHCLVITDVCRDRYVAISANGKYGCGYIHELKKTGRHFNAIEEVLEKMKEGE